MNHRNQIKIIHAENRAIAYKLKGELAKLIKQVQHIEILIMPLQIHT